MTQNTYKELYMMLFQESSQEFVRQWQGMIEADPKLEETNRHPLPGLPAEMSMLAACMNATLAHMLATMLTTFPPPKPAHLLKKKM